MSKVFISYSHDTPEHKELVLAFSERLRRDGIETSLDRYVQGTPPQKWPRWMLDQVDWADFVLLVCTETYYLRFRSHEVPGKGKGADWEGAIITQEIYDSRSTTTKFVPVMFDLNNEPFIPEPVRGHTFYVINSDPNYQDLHDFLLGQAGIEPGPIGEPKKKERNQVAPLIFGDTGTTGQHTPQISPTRLTHGAEHLFGRENELAALDNAWDDPKIHAMTVVAFGGVGKTSLIFEWMNRKAADGLPGMERVFDWSFYSMGTREQGDASSDSFIKAALIFFGDGEMAESAASAWDKGARLAVLVAERPTLLVLDGLEPLQYPPGQQTGKLKDPAVETLLKGLARRNSGLCVVTTRESIADLAPFQDTTASELLLHRLSTPAGAGLLKHLGVRGSEAELDKLVDDVKGHALTLNLLGRFLAEAHGGDIRRRDMVDILEADDEIQGGHAFRVIEAYEKWLAGEKKEGRRLLAVLNLLALFDRPADYRCIEALRKEPAIHGLTETLVDQGKGKWNITLNRLQKCGLISLSSSSPAPAVDVWSSGASLDTHPIIREYFAKRLREQNHKAWCMAHKRLYEHLTESTYDKRQPTLEDLVPLYQAVFHGCQAGMFNKACNEVYMRRILRGTNSDGYYSFRKLGAFGPDLGAVACFFKEPWKLFSPTLSESDQAWLLSMASNCLKALGRIADSLEPLGTSIEFAIKREDWHNATIGSINLSELQLTLGNVAGALREAERAVTFADCCGKSFERYAACSTYADALHHAGHRSEALALFSKAEEIQVEDQPKYPLLYSVLGFQYCELLLAESERVAWQVFLKEEAGSRSVEMVSTCREVEARATMTCTWEEDMRHAPLLDLALHHLTLSRAGLLATLIESATLEFNSARLEIDQAVTGLRTSGHMNELSRGLLSRAWLRFMEGDEPSARDDLDEAWVIVERGPMRLHMADILLYRARLFRDREALKQARALIEQCGYWRRKEELEDAEAAAGSWPL